MCDEYLSDYSDDSNDTDDGVSSETYFDEFDDVSDQESSEDFGLELEGEYDDDIIDYEEGPTELDEMLAECESDDMAYNEYYDMEKEEALEDMMDELYGSDEAEDIIQNEYYDAIARCHVAGTSTVFIEFMLSRIDKILDEISVQIR